MATVPPMLHMLCGKVAAGKSTLAAQLGSTPGTVIVAEDEWLNVLFSGEISSMSDYINHSTKLRKIAGPHVSSLLNAGLSVVLDFQANTIDSRAWFQTILEATNASHQLHFLATPDEVCLKRLRLRNAKNDHPFTANEAQFFRISKHFVPPSVEEGFNVVRYDGSTQNPQS